MEIFILFTKWRGSQPINILEEIKTIQLSFKDRLILANVSVTWFVSPKRYRAFVALDPIRIMLIQ